MQVNYWLNLYKKLSSYIFLISKGKMHHSQKKVLNFNAKDIYSLVLDIEKYPLFLPYVSSAKILSKNENQLTARLGVNFKGFTSSYTSKVIMLPGGDFNKDLSEIKVKWIKPN